MRVKHPKLSSEDCSKLVRKIVESDMKNDDYYTEIDFIDEDGNEYIFTNRLKDDKNKKR